MISLQEVKNRCKRENAKENNQLHWFSSMFSIYFSYFFIRLKLTADQVTIVFFLLGLTGAIFYSTNTLLCSLLGYLFFRLHIIVDMSDGDVARFNKSYSIRGAYWDAMIHSILNPLYCIAISFAMYTRFDDVFFLLLSPFMALSAGLVMAVKNNYYKACYFNNLQKESVKKSTPKKNIKYWMFYIASEVLSMEGFVLGAVIVTAISTLFVVKMYMLLFLLANILVCLIKFYQLSYTGKTFSKS